MMKYVGFSNEGMELEVEKYVGFSNFSIYMYICIYIKTFINL